MTVCIPGDVVSVSTTVLIMIRGEVTDEMQVTRHHEIDRLALQVSSIACQSAV